MEGWGDGSEGQVFAEFGYPGKASVINVCL